MSSEEHIFRWLAICVAKLGGEVQITPEDLEKPINLHIRSDDNSNNLILSCKMDDEE